MRIGQPPAWCGWPDFSRPLTLARGARGREIRRGSSHLDRFDRSR
jgi:hypothetical protein